MSSGDAFGSTSTPQFLPGYHGSDGDKRYPSPRRLRSTGAAFIDFVLLFGPALVLSVLVVAVEIPRTYSYVLLPIPFVIIGANRILLRKWVHASVGELIFGLVEIRGRDGAWPGWSELLSGRAPGHDGVPNIVAVRRCDIRGRGR
ncbi:RDD family protein [Nocardia rhamnosiphila]|uniref:RDD family protein n=1 Tax=Nocardia rhamnosiphila TaxID=426716 RepID=A0ABV2WPB2_9NOCA|nr:RDD family protein [Nocardia rhamnosiphila]